MHRFEEEGARVLVADVNTGAFDELARTRGDKVRWGKCDVTDKRDIAAAMQAAVDARGGLDVVFNNTASAASLATIDQISAAEWDRTQVLLLRSVARGIRHASTHMKACRCLLDTSSVSPFFV